MYSIVAHQNLVFLSNLLSNIINLSPTFPLQCSSQPLVTIILFWASTRSTFFYYTWVTLCNICLLGHSLFQLMQWPPVPSIFSQMIGFHLFYCQIVFLCVCMPYFLYLFISWWILGLYPFLDIVYSAAMNLGVQTSLKYTDLISLEIQVVGFLDHMTVLILIFWGFSVLFSITVLTDFPNNVNIVVNTTVHLKILRW